MKPEPWDLCEIIVPGNNNDNSLDKGPLELVFH